MKLVGAVQSIATLMPRLIGIGTHDIPYNICRLAFWFAKKHWQILCSEICEDVGECAPTRLI